MIAYSNFLQSYLIRYSLAIGLVLSLLAFCVYKNRLPETSGDLSLMFPSSSDALSLLNKEETLFDSGVVDFISFDTQATDRDEYIFQMEELEARLFTLSGVQKVIMPLNSDISSIFGLTSHDGRYARIAFVSNPTLTHKDKRELNQEINHTLKDYTLFSPKRSGPLFISMAVSEGITRELERLTPWVLGSLLIVLPLILQNFILTICTLVSTLLSILITVLLFSASGFQLGPVSQITPSFLLAVGGCFHLHYAARVKRSSETELIKELRKGILLSALTTSAGMFSLLNLDMVDINRFGVVSGLGTLISALFACILIPSPTTTSNENTNRVYIPFQRTISIITVITSLILACGIIELEVHTDPKDFLPARSIARKELTEFEGRFKGNHFLSVLIDSKDASLSEVLKRLHNMPDVVRVISSESFSSIAERMEEFRESLIEKETDSTEFYSHSGGVSRLLIETTQEGKPLRALAERIKVLLKKANLSGGPTSVELILSEQSSTVVYGLITSLAYMLGLVFLLLVVVFKNVPLAIIGLVPNVIPLCVVFGFLGYYYGSLNIGTCLVAATSLGLTVDNTFHLLLCTKKNCAFDSSPRGIVKTVEEITFPFLASTISLITVFGWLSFAESLPVSQFALFLSLALIAGVLADVIVLPTIMKYMVQHNYLNLKEKSAKGPCN